MKSLKQTYSIHAPVEKVWTALVDPKIIDMWGGGPAKMSDKDGEEFSLWGGDIVGKNTKIVHKKELHQDWMAKHWKEASKVSFVLSEKDGVTTVDLVHTNIPDKELKDIEEGWKSYYMNPLKDLVEKL